MTIDLAKLRAETLALIDGTTPGTTCTHCYGRSANDRCLNCGAYLPAPTLAADTLRLLDDNLRLLDEIEQLKRALVEAAIPLEAMILAAQDERTGRRLYGELWDGVVAGAKSARATHDFGDDARPPTSQSCAPRRWRSWTA